MLLGALANPRLPCEGQWALQAIFTDGPARAANGSQISFRLQCCCVVFAHRFQWRSKNLAMHWQEDCPQDLRDLLGHMFMFCVRTKRKRRRQ